MTPQGIVQIFNVTAVPPQLLANIALDASGGGSVSKSDIPAGTYDIQASYTGGTGTPPSKSAVKTITVNPPAEGTTTTLTVTPLESDEGDAILFSVTVTQP